MAFYATEQSPWNTEIVEMKRQYLIWMLLVLIVPSTGCQSCLSRFRGARCRPAFTLPTLRGTRTQAEPPCAEGCNTANYSPAFAPPAESYAPYIQPGSVHIDGAPVGEGGIVSGPIESSYYSTNRPMVSGPVVTSSPVPAEGNILAVPGPELGPLPASN